MNINCNKLDSNTSCNQYYNPHYKQQYKQQYNPHIPIEKENLNDSLLSYNQLTDSIPNSNLTNFTHLGLNNNQLTGSIPNSIGNLTNLEQLGLDTNQLTGVMPDYICDLDILHDKYLYFVIIKFYYNIYIVIHSIFV
jgi:Leucine-rich repeat (LRR) protein